MAKRQTRREINPLAMKGMSFYGLAQFDSEWHPIHARQTT